MLRMLTAGLAAIALCCAPGGARSQPASGGEGGAMSGAELAKRREALIAQCPPVPTPSDAEAAKLPIHVTRWGTEGPRVVIIHGGVQGRLGGGPATFSGQQAWGGDGWRVELVDRPGFGQSPSRGVDDMERDAAWIADMLGNGANLIGHSWGGAEALLAAARRPEAVRSLVLVEPALAAVAEADPSLRNNPAVQAGAAQRARLLTAANTPAEYAATFARMVGTDPAEAGRMGCALLQARMAPFDVLQRAIGTVARAKIPVLIVTGGWNGGFDAAADVLAKLTHGRHLVVRSPNHFVQLANAQDFNREVGAFMRGADRPPEIGPEKLEAIIAALNGGVHATQAAVCRTFGAKRTTDRDTCPRGMVGPGNQGDRQGAGVPISFLNEEQERRHGRYAGEPAPEQQARYFHLDDADRAFVASRLGAHMRLGFAVQLGTVRFLGTFLEQPADVPAQAVAFMAGQLGTQAAGLLAE